MSESEFIELAIRYLDGAADRAQVDRLEASMLGQPQRRHLYRQLVQQAQIAHELLSLTPKALPVDAHAHAQKAVASPRRGSIAFISVASAAAILILAAIVFKPMPAELPIRSVVAAEQERGKSWVEIFEMNPPSWPEIYHSPFDYPAFVWRSLIGDDASDSDRVDDAFPDNSRLLTLSVESSDFSQLIAPIALLPSGEDFGSKLY